jgi:hypothetical protein
MPLKWVNPQLFLTCNHIKVYLTYRNNDFSTPQTYWYNTSVQEDDDFEFDVRDLPGYDPKKDDTPEGHKKTIRNAIKAGLIRIPEED